MKQIIAEFGGTNKAAEIFGVSPQAVSNWKADGQFPKGRRYEALMILQAHGIEAAPEVFGAPASNVAA